MKRLAYIGAILIIESLVAFILLLIAGGYILEGEAAIGAGYTWWYSIPMCLVLSIIIGLLTFNRYCELGTIFGKMIFLSVLATVIVVSAPVITFAGYTAVVMLGGRNVT